MSEEPLKPELAAIEAALAALAPRPAAIDRDRLMFLAGQAAGERAGTLRCRTRWLWPLAAAASLLLTATFAVMWASHTGPQSKEQVAEVPPQAPSQMDTPNADTGDRPAFSMDYLRLRQRVIDQGVDALGEPSPSQDVQPTHPTPPPTRRDLISQLMQG